MNFMAILKQIFPNKPTLEEFILMHKPTDAVQVEHLERQYDKMIAFSRFYI